MEHRRAPTVDELTARIKGRLSSEDALDELIDAVRAELKSARRAGQISSKLPLIYGGFADSDAMQEWFDKKINGRRKHSLEFRALARALALPPTERVGDVTSRRSKFAKEARVSERTAARYEDEAIEKLAVELVNEVLLPQIRENSLPGVELQDTESDLKPTTEDYTDRKPSPKIQVTKSAAEMRAEIDRRRKLLDDISAHLEEIERLEEDINQLDSQIQPLMEKHSALIDRRIELMDEVTRLQDQMSGQA